MYYLVVTWGCDTFQPILSPIGLTNTGTRRGSSGLCVPALGKAPRHQTKSDTQSTVYILTIINEEASEIVNYMTPEAEVFMIRRFRDIGQTD